MEEVVYDRKSNAFQGEIRNGLPQVMWHITDRCPLACPYCFATKTERDAPRGDIATTIERLKELGVQKIDIGGGEPLVYQYLDDVLAESRHHGIAVTITTSGTGSRKAISWLVANADKFSRVILSLDGPAALHDDLRGRPGTFNSLRALATSLRPTAVGRFRVNTVVTSRFADSSFLDGSIESVRGLAPSEWCLIQPHPANKKQAFDEFSVDDEDFSSLVAQVRLRSKGEPWSVISRTKHDYAGYWVLYPDGRLRPHTDGSEDGPGFDLLEGDRASALATIQSSTVSLPALKRTR